jgi:hypothetical protein
VAARRGAAASFPRRSADTCAQSRK